jgi:hypothetical protein
MKKKKGLKEKLEPRHKTLPQPETMHDFGELGKWSEGTLKMNLRVKNNWYKGEIMDSRYFCKQIEKEYNELEKEYCIAIKNLESKRYFFPLLKTVLNDCTELKETKKRYNKLHSDYYYHLSIVEKMIEKMRKKINLFDI